MSIATDLSQGWSAASFFGTPVLEGSVSSSGSSGGGAAPVAAAGSATRVFQRTVFSHPRFALGVLVVGTVGLATFATHPIAGARASAHLGRASGSVEGEV